MSRAAALAAASAAVARSCSTAARSSAAILSSAMRVRRSISASASVFALATISSASCFARSRSASRSLSTEADFASYAAFSASASLRSDCASASWSRISAILLSSARPMAPGTFFQIRMAITTSIASATQPPGLSPRKVGSTSAIELGLHRGNGFLGIDQDSGESGDHFPRGFGGHRFNLAAGGYERVADPGLGRLDLDVELVRGGLDLCLTFEGARLLRLLRNPRRFDAGSIHPFAPGRFGLVGGRASRLGGLQIAADLLLAGFDRCLDLGNHPAPDHEEDEAERDRQPEELRQQDFGKLRELRH